MAYLVGASCGCHGTHCTLGAMAPQDGAPQPPCPVSWCNSGHRLDAPVHVRTMLVQHVGEVEITVELVKIRDESERCDLTVSDESFHRQTRLSLDRVRVLRDALTELLDLAGRT